MSKPLERYALLGDLQTAALVADDGAIDWLCLPRFDSDACFAALLGDERHGAWRIEARGRKRARRAYREGTLVLETEVETEDGAIRLVECMPPRRERPDLVRIVEGIRGTVAVHMELRVRFGYGAIAPWITRVPEGAMLMAGPDALLLRSPVPLEISHEEDVVCADFRVGAGERVALVLEWFPAHRSPAPALDASRLVADTEAWWRSWLSRCNTPGPHHDAATSSLVFLKALTYAPSGGIVAAATTSLPEEIGGERNWDYRFCWLRDATFTLLALLENGFTDEACAWRDWLLRAIAGSPRDAQIMYGVDGRRRLDEATLDWLPGYEGSAPVRIGNAAVRQRQLDVYGEVIDCLYQARRAGLTLDADSWTLQRALLEFLESIWREPDAGIWEVRGPPRHFTHSKLMTWVAFDRAVKTVEELRVDGPVERWRAIRDEIRAEVLRKAWNEERGAFVQYYGSSRVDASLLMMPQVGFLPASDPRFVSTVAAIERDLVRDGLVLRYLPDEEVEGVGGGEGTFLACSFWLADAYALGGRIEDAKRTFERILALRNDVGLLSEEWDPVRKRLVGNFPQAYSHVSLVNTARNLVHAGPAEHRP